MSDKQQPVPPEAADPSDAQPTNNAIPEVFPERHILPEMPDEQEALLTGKPLGPKGEPRYEEEAEEEDDSVPQFIEPRRKPRVKPRPESQPVSTSAASTVAPTSQPRKNNRPIVGSTPVTRSIPAATVSKPVSERAAKVSTKVGSVRVGSTPKRKSTSVPAKKVQSASVPRVRGPRYGLVMVVSAIRSLALAFSAAVVVATIFMWWTSPDFLPAQTRLELAPVQATARQFSVTRTALPTPVWFNRIGVLAGHSGPSQSGLPDPGATCPDGFNELSVTTRVAEAVVANLRGRGYTVDQFEEWDSRLASYQAAAFISLHADSCEDFGYGGFKSTYPSVRTTVRELDLRLDQCIRENYAPVTGLEFRADNITENMRQYHAFREIGPTTPAVILELGFLSHDRDLLQNGTDKMATGIANGLRCFIESDIGDATSTPPAQPLAPVPAPTGTSGG